MSSTVYGIDYWQSAFRYVLLNPVFEPMWRGRERVVSGIDRRMVV